MAKEEPTLCVNVLEPCLSRGLKGPDKRPCLPSKEVQEILSTSPLPLSSPCDASGFPGLLKNISHLGSNEDLLADRDSRLHMLENGGSWHGLDSYEPML